MTNPLQQSQEAYKTYTVGSIPANNDRMSNMEVFATLGSEYKPSNRPMQVSKII